MKVILYILLAIVAMFIIFALGVILVTFYRLATGKISKEEQARILANAERERAKKKQEKKSKKRSRRLCGGLSDPSTLPRPIRDAMGFPF